MVQMKYPGDKYYIEQVLAGRQAAYSYLVDRHKDRAFNLAFRISCSREEAEEIAQDAFLKAYNNLPHFRMDSSFATWLYRIVYNTAISFSRKENKNVLSLEDFPAEFADFAGASHSEEEAEKEYNKALVNFALQKLDEIERGLITLYYYEDMDIAEISAISGLTESNVKVRLFRARQKMSAILQKTVYKKGICHETQG